MDRDAHSTPQDWLLFQFGEINRRLDRHGADNASALQALNTKFDTQIAATSALCVALDKRVLGLEDKMNERAERRRRFDKLAITLVSAPWVIEVVRLLMQHGGPTK